MKPMHRLFHNRSLRALAVVLLLDALYFSFVPPSPGRSIVLLGGYILLAATFYTGLEVFLRALRAVFDRPRLHLHRLAVAGTIVGVILVALQSIGQLSLRDVLVALGLAVVGYLYSVYILPKRKQ